MHWALQGSTIPKLPTPRRARSAEVWERFSWPPYPIPNRRADPEHRRYPLARKSDGVGELERGRENRSRVYGNADQYRRTLSAADLSFKRGPAGSASVGAPSQTGRGIAGLRLLPPHPPGGGTYAAVPSLLEACGPDPPLFTECRAGRCASPARRLIPVCVQARTIW